MGALARTMVVGVLDGGVGTHGSKFFPRGGMPLAMQGTSLKMHFLHNPNEFVLSRVLCRKYTVPARCVPRRNPRNNNRRSAAAAAAEVGRCGGLLMRRAELGWRGDEEGDRWGTIERKEQTKKSRLKAGGGLLAAEVARDCQCFNHFFWHSRTSCAGRRSTRITTTWWRWGQPGSLRRTTLSCRRRKSRPTLRLPSSS